jgi:3-oxoacyl-[acyl-carrier-protein] synthase-3
MGSMSAVNIPFGLHVAERQGRLKDGDLAVFFAGGSGETWSSVAVRWVVDGFVTGLAAVEALTGP